MTETIPIEAFPLTEKFQITSHNEKPRSQLFLWFSVITVCLIVVSSGAALMWTAPTLEKLKIDDPNINPLGSPITVYEESLITSLHSVGFGVGPLLLGKLSDLFGRKKSLLLFASFELTGFVILAFGNHVYYYYAARTLQGFSLGFIITTLPLFIAEITEDSNRGKFGTFISLFSTLGNVYGFVIALMFETRLFTLMCIVPIIISITLFTLFVPESPIYWASKQNSNKAKQSIKKYRNVSLNEAEKILCDLEYTITQTSGKRNQFQLIRLLDIKKSLCISCGLFCLQQFAGLFAILAYLGSILSKANLPISNNTSSIAVGFTQIVSILISSVLIERLGRKFLLLLSTVIVVISLFILGIYFHLEESNVYYISQITWLPLLSMIIFIIGYGVGIGPITFVIIGEIFPTDLKTLAASISVFICGLANFTVVFTFPLCRDMLGFSWCFWILGSISVLGGFFIFIFIPETKGKSFLEIQKMLHRK